MKVNKANSRRKVRKAIAVYLVISALYAVGRIGFGGSELLGSISSMWLMAMFLGATLAGGVGLFLGKNWGYWTTVVVLSLQLVRIQLGGFGYDVLSMIGIYVYAAGSLSIGISASIDPSLTLSTETDGQSWVGVNVFIVLLLGNLLAAKKVGG